MYFLSSSCTCVQEALYKHLVLVEYRIQKKHAAENVYAYAMLLLICRHFIYVHLKQSHFLELNILFCAIKHQTSNPCVT